MARQHKGLLLKHQDPELSERLPTLVGLCPSSSLWGRLMSTFRRQHGSPQSCVPWLMKFAATTDLSQRVCEFLGVCFLLHTSLLGRGWVDMEDPGAWAKCYQLTLSSHLVTGRCLSRFEGLCKFEGPGRIWKEWFEWRSNHSMWHRAYHKIISI